MAEQKYASIVQLTDLHLFVDPKGATLPPGRQSPFLERAAPIFKELGHASAGSVRDLRRIAPLVVREEAQWLDGAGPVIVVQSGDVEAYGMLQEEPFSGFRFLDEMLYPTLRGMGAAEIVGVFGNHDAWPGTWPPLFGQSAVVKELGDAGHVPPPLPCLVEVPGGPSVVLVNTVWSQGIRSGIQGGVLGSGRVTAHLPDAVLPLSNSPAPVVEILAMPPPDPGVPRVAVMHHPPHLFDERFGHAWTTGLLDGADELAEALESAGVSLVLAGHRHRIFPPADTTTDARTAIHDPLRTGTLQVASGSPTVGDALHRGISVFRLYRDEAEGLLHVDRRIRTTIGSNERRRQARRLIRNLPLP
jgi:hypothetical protein